MISIFSVVLFHSMRNQLSKTKYYIYVKTHEDTLNKFVEKIKSESNIFHMSSGERSQKSLNNFNVVYTRNDRNTSDNKIYIDDILEREQIEKSVYDDFRKQLISLGFLSFRINSDSSITFIVDGYLDDVYGIQYFDKQLDHTQTNFKFNQKNKIVDDWYIY